MLTTPHQTLKATPTSKATPTLPQPSTPFIGRDKEKANIATLLAEPDCRLLSLVGPGGIGKTRLALAVATSLTEDYRHGVYFVPLQSIDTVEHLITAIMEALGLSLHGQETPRTQLLTALAEREALLLLDNFEQLLPANGSQLLTDILDQAPDVTLLVTSRAALNLREEWLYPVRGLAIPGQAKNDEQAADAIRLFEERAGRVRRHFSLAEAQQPVVHICRLVEGMPLAIELAAAWLRTLDCAAIAAEIRRNLDFLSTTMRNVPDRHQNIQAVFDHSWRLLTAEERRGFKRLSIFRGGFQRAAAERVTGATLPILSALVNKCMIRREGGRYTIHELLRQYGQEKLQESAAEAAQIRAGHARYYADFLDERRAAVNGPAQRQAATEIAADLENIWAAWQWAVAQVDVEIIRRAATTYYLFCQFRSYFLEGAEALDAAAVVLEQQPESADRDLTLAELYSNEGWLRIRLGEFERAQMALERSRALYTHLDQPPPSYMGADPATPLAILATMRGAYEEAAALGEASRRASDARDDIHNLYFAHYGLAVVRLAQGQYEAAYRHAEQACTLARSAGNRWFLSYPLNEWGNVARAMGQYAEARDHYRASYAIKEAYDDPEGMAVALSHLGEMAMLQEAFQEADERFRQSLQIYRELNDRGGLATSLKGLGQVACARQEPAVAADHFRQALEIAIDIRFLPLVCAIIIEAAPLLRQADRPALDVALLTLVREHPAADHEIAGRAGARLAQWAAELTAEAFSEAEARGRSWDLKAGVSALQAQLEALTTEEQTDREPEPEQALVEPLTDRELEVLRLMAEGQTNPDIAETLVIALGTVKWYASQIYAKLEVANRTEATVRAKQLGLLE